MLDGLVAQHITIIRVILTWQLRHCLQSGIETDVDSRLTFDTTLCGDKDNAVSTLHTINGSSGCVLQH